MGTNNRKRAIRQMMAATGLKYTQAAREIERQKSLAAEPGEAGDELVTATETMLVSTLPPLPPAPVGTVTP